MEKIKLMYQSYEVTIYHKQGETNEKLVFLHGGGLDHAMLSWKEIIALVGNRYDIYAIDLLGYGKSDKPDLAYSLPMYVELVHAIFCRLTIKKTHLVGLSMGGGISIGFSLKYPEMIHKLALVGSMGYTNHMAFQRLSRWFVHSWLNKKSYEWLGKSKKMVQWSIEATLIGDKNKVSDELVNTLYHLLHQPKCHLAWESFQRYELGKKRLTTDLASHLSELKMPILIVNGEKDGSVPVKDAIAASKVIENSQLYIMSGCKHWAQKERPEEFVQVLNAFLMQN